MMGRRLTTLRVREMQISRQVTNPTPTPSPYPSPYPYPLPLTLPLPLPPHQVTAQDAELKGLRGERAERHKEVDLTLTLTLGTRRRARRRST